MYCEIVLLCWDFSFSFLMNLKFHNHTPAPTVVLLTFWRNCVCHTSGHFQHICQRGVLKTGCVRVACVYTRWVCLCGSSGGELHLAEAAAAADQEEEGGGKRGKHTMRFSGEPRTCLLLLNAYLKAWHVLQEWFASDNHNTCSRTRRQHFLGLFSSHATIYSSVLK